ncbi:MAG: right-handed parallel beta-helix repeat-containing protein [Emcibacter sp.]|nr:right-handed parallel beta-helix repeat-containing protein [Emcibacter sp.]
MSTTPITEQQLIDAATDAATIAEIANGSALTVMDRLGNTKKTMAGVRASAKYEIPTSYFSGLNITTETQTVDSGGVIYAIKPSSLPIASTPEIFNGSDWYPIQDTRGYHHEDSSADMTDLSESSLWEGDRVEVKYRTTDGDRAGGRFRVTKSAITPDGGVNFAFDSDPTGASGGFVREFMGFVIEIHWFGAIGNGSTDDTVAVRAALDYVQLIKAVMHIPSGIYIISSTLVITSFCVVIGDGAASVLKSSDGGEHIIIFAQPDNGVIEGLHLSGFKIDGNGGGALNAGLIQTNNCAPFYYNNLTVINGSRALPPGGVNGISVSSTGLTTLSLGTITNCYFENCSKGAINWTGTAGAAGGIVCYIAFNTITNMAGNLQTPGIQINSGMNGKVIANDVSRCEGAGIILGGGCNNVEVAFNTCYENGQGFVQGAGIYFGNGYSPLYRGTNAMIHDNHCYKNGVNVPDSGIKVENNDGASLKNNKCWDNSLHGLFGDVSNDISVDGNECWNNNTANLTGGSGMSFRGVVGASVGHNNCYDNQGSQTQQYGLSIANACDDFKIYDNDLDNNKIGDINANTGYGIPPQVSMRHSGFITTTTDDTPTNQFLLPIPDNSAYFVSMKAVARQDTGGNRAAYEDRIFIYRNSGDAAIQGVKASPFSEESNGVWSSELGVAGTSIRRRVTGAAGQVIKWKVNIEIESI